MKSNASQTLRLACLNLQNFTQPPHASYEWENIYTPLQWQQKCQWLQNLLSDIASDVIACQEVFSVDALQSLMASAGYPFTLASGEPVLIDDHVFQKPVQFLASRYPLKLHTWPSPTLEQNSLFPSSFSYSRTPLLATVELPQLGNVRIVVCHLKSARANNDLHDYPALALWQPAQQRGLEAAMLWQQLLALYLEQPLPTILMGDFNDELASALLQPLLLSQATGTGLFRLQDAAALAGETTRTPTHYYGAEGRVLDYVLLSAEFDPRQHLAKGSVCGYQVYDEHLVRPVFSKDGYSSDHAAVIVDLTYR